MNKSDLVNRNTLDAPTCEDISKDSIYDELIELSDGKSKEFNINGSFRVTATLDKVIDNDRYYKYSIVTPNGKVHEGLSFSQSDKLLSKAFDDKAILSNSNEKKYKFQDKEYDINEIKEMYKSYGKKLEINYNKDDYEKFSELKKFVEADKRQNIESLKKDPIDKIKNLSREI